MIALPASTLQPLRGQPFDLLREMERRSRVAAAGAHGEEADLVEWVGVGFRLGTERFWCPGTRCGKC